MRNPSSRDREDSVTRKLCAGEPVQKPIAGCKTYRCQQSKQRQVILDIGASIDLHHNSSGEVDHRQQAQRLDESSNWCSNRSMHTSIFAASLPIRPLAFELTHFRPIC